MTGLCVRRAHRRFVRRRRGETEQDEAHIPAEPPPPEADAWFPQADEHPERAPHPEEPAREGPQAAGGLLSRTLSRRERLRQRREFLRVQRTGLRSRGRYLTLLGLPNGLDVTRLGVVASRRLGKAFRRNRSRRLVRELFRLDKRRAGFDLVVLPRPELCDAPFAVLQADYRNALRRFERSHGC